MKKPETLSSWDFSDTVRVQGVYGSTTVPDLTRENFNKLIEEYNNLVKFILYYIKEGPCDD